MPNPHGGSEVVSVSPNPVPLGTSYAINGVGFDPNVKFGVFVVANPGGTEYKEALSDANGAFSLPGWGSSATSLTVEVKTTSAPAGKVLTTCSFTIE